MAGAVKGLDQPPDALDALTHKRLMPHGLQQWHGQGNAAAPVDECPERYNTTGHREIRPQRSPCKARMGGHSYL